MIASKGGLPYNSQDRRYKVRGIPAAGNPNPTRRSQVASMERRVHSVDPPAPNNRETVLLSPRGGNARGGLSQGFFFTPPKSTLDGKGAVAPPPHPPPQHR